MKKLIAILSLLTAVASCGGGSSSNQPFTTGMYSGQVFSNSESGRCSFVSPYISYGVQITKETPDQQNSQLLIEKILTTIAGNSGTGIGTTVPAGSGDASFTDFDANPEFPTEHFISDDGTGNSLDLSCFAR